MITGAHAVIFSKDPEADRAFLRDVLRFPYVDVGGGWLIFGLPPSEVAVHPAAAAPAAAAPAAAAAAEATGRHELYLMCEDVEAFVCDMAARDVVCGPVTDLRWGLLTEVVLPGGGKLGVYQPRHARPPR
jgi:hypothetical protein